MKDLEKAKDDVCDKDARCRRLIDRITDMQLEILNLVRDSAAAQAEAEAAIEDIDLVSDILTNTCDDLYRKAMTILSQRLLALLDLDAIEIARGAGKKDV